MVPPFTTMISESGTGHIIRENPFERDSSVSTIGLYQASPPTILAEGRVAGVSEYHLVNLCKNSRMLEGSSGL